MTLDELKEEAKDVGKTVFCGVVISVLAALIIASLTGGGNSDSSADN